MTVLDHLVYAVADLERGRRWLAAATGVDAAVGGAHPGRGTHNALASLGWAYLELIAPDPDQPEPDGPRPFGLDDLAEEGLVAFAVRPDDGDTIDDLLGRSLAAGHDPGPVIAMSRRTPDGALLDWRNTLPPAAPGGVVPFVIDWGSTAPPNTAAPGGLELVAFEIGAPDPERVRTVLDALELDITVTARSAPGLRATLRGPEGTIDLRPATD